MSSKYLPEPITVNYNLSNEEQRQNLKGQYDEYKKQSSLTHSYFDELYPALEGYLYKKNKNWKGEYMVNEKISEIENIKNVLNEELKKKVSEYNTNNNLSNNQANTIEDVNHYLDLQNNKLNRQLKHLEKIQNEIAIKDRIVKANNESLRKKDRNLLIIKMFLSSLFILAIPLALYLGGGISFQSFAILVFLYVIGFSMFVYYKWNILFGDPKFKNPSSKESSDDCIPSTTSGKPLTPEQKYLMYHLDSYTKSRCDCPDYTDCYDVPETTEFTPDDNNSKSNKSLKTGPLKDTDRNIGFIYDDGVSPEIKVV